MAANKIVQALRTHGLEVDAIALTDIQSPTRLLEQAREVFSGGAAKIESCGSTTKTAARLVTECREVADGLMSVEARSCSDDDLAETVWQLLQTWSAGRSAGAAAEGIRCEIRDEHDRLRRAAAACVIRPHEKALVTLAGLYRDSHHAAKRARSLLDFDDLQHEVERLLRSRDDVRAELSSSLRLSMVDEFQDTDRLQLSIITALAGENLCTVGDEYQSIYGFRGADIEAYRAHLATMQQAGARGYELADNYRSHPGVLGFVNEVFATTAFADGDLIELRPGRAEPDSPVLKEDIPRVEVVLVDSPGRGAAKARETEAQEIASQFARLRDEHGVDSADMVVLLRSYTHADVYAAQLRARGFEAVVAGGSRFLSRPEIVRARLMLRVIANPHDEEALYGLLAGEWGGVSDEGLWRLTRGEGGLRVDDARNAGRITDALASAREFVGVSSLGDVLLLAIERSGVTEWLRYRGGEGERELMNLLRLARMARDYETEGGAGPAGFAAYLDDRERFGEHTAQAAIVDEECRAVRIMSIHASKGLEFPFVAVVETGSSAPADRGIVRLANDPKTGRLRMALAPPGTAGSARDKADRPEAFVELETIARRAAAEEAKRLFYVACTRAREGLLVSGAVDFSKPSLSSSSPSTADRMRAAWEEVVAAQADSSADIVCGGSPVTVRIVAAAEDAADETEQREGGQSVAETALQAGSMVSGSSALVALEALRGISLVHEGARGAVPLATAPERLSYSDIARFETCRMRDRLGRVLRVGRVERPDPGSATRFGSAVHAALQVCPDNDGTDSERLAAIARGFGLDDEHATAMKKAVEAFRGSAVAAELATCDRVRREWGFSVMLGRGTEPFLFEGAIDAYGRSGFHAVIVDYKTGSGGTAAQLEERYRGQAESYALVALLDGCDEVETVFVRPEVTDADGRMQEVRFTFTSADAERLESRIVEVRREMSASDGAPLAQWDRDTCGSCTFAGGLCPRTPPR